MHYPSFKFFGCNVSKPERFLEKRKLTGDVITIKIQILIPKTQYRNYYIQNK